MAIIINPITTVLLSEEEVGNPEFNHFMFKYILDKDKNISLRSTLTGGRYVHKYVASLAGKTLPAPTIQPLIDGKKIPISIMHQISQFFRDVMKMTGSSTMTAHGGYEAQAFVVYRNDEYQIVIPSQTVSKASVSYDLNGSILPDDIIVMDIHSHNSMGAFWSGTDDRDDRKNPWISGVFGKLNTTMEYKFRFNDGAGNSYDMLLSDIFQDSKDIVVTPAEWMSKVKVGYTQPIVNRTVTSKTSYYGGGNSKKKTQTSQEITEELDWIQDLENGDLTELLLGGYSGSGSFDFNTATSGEDRELLTVSEDHDADILIDYMETTMEEVVGMPHVIRDVVQKLCSSLLGNDKVNLEFVESADLYMDIYQEIRNNNYSANVISTALAYVKDTYNV